MAEESLGETTSAEESPAENTALTADPDAVEAEASTEETVSEDADKADHDASKKPEDGEADKGIEGAPETYGDFTLPEGRVMDEKLLEEALPVLKDANLTQDEAQKFVDLHLKLSEHAIQSQQKAWADQQGEWRQAAEDDEEYGGSKYDASIATARRAMRDVGGPALAHALEDTGTGNHPEFIRFFKRVGDAMGEDSFNFGGASKEGGKTVAERMFPNQGKVA